MKCELAQSELPLLLYGELPFEQEEQIEQHLRECEQCRMELDRIRCIAASVDATELEPSSDLLLACRRNLRASIAQREAAQRGGWFRNWPSAGWMKPVGVCALLAIGYIAGREVPVVGETPEPLRAPVAARVRYVEPSGSGQVKLLVDETSQRVIQGGMEDDRIRGLLLNAARESGDPALRVESVELLNSSANSADVRALLLHTLQHDPNPGVRLKALDGLRAFASLPETRRALTKTLLSDQHPGVRTQVVDLLVQNPEPAMVGVLQEVVRHEDNSYVRARCQKVLHEMRASVDAF